MLIRGLGWCPEVHGLLIKNPQLLITDRFLPEPASKSTPQWSAWQICWGASLTPRTSVGAAGTRGSRVREWVQEKGRRKETGKGSSISPALTLYDDRDYRPHLWKDCEFLQDRKGGVSFLGQLHHIPTAMLHNPCQCLWLHFNVCNHSLPFIIAFFPHFILKTNLRHFYE